MMIGAAIGRARCGRLCRVQSADVYHCGSVVCCRPMSRAR